MNAHRRTLAALLLLAALPAAAQFKPSRPVELVVHTGPGGGNDVLARAIAAMAEKEKLLPVRLQVANRPGGNGLVSIAYLAEKRGDQGTIGLFTTTLVSAWLTSAEAKVGMKDLTPVARLVQEPAVIAVKADAPYKTLGELIEAAKKSPGQLKQSGGSTTSRDNLVRLMLQRSSGARWAFISFPGGGERIAALLGGHVNLMVIEPEEAGEHIRAGRMRVLAQISDTRLRGFPGTPTLKEAGFDVPLVPQIRGMVAPPGIPAENVAYWEGFARRLTQSASWKKYVEDNQFQDGYQGSAELAKSLGVLTDRMRDVLKEAGVRVAN